MILVLHRSTSQLSPPSQKDPRPVVLFVHDPLANDPHPIHGSLKEVLHISDCTKARSFVPDSHVADFGIRGPSHPRPQTVIRTIHHDRGSQEVPRLHPLWQPPTSQDLVSGVPHVPSLPGTMFLDVSLSAQVFPQERLGPSSTKLSGSQSGNQSLVVKSKETENLQQSQRR